MSRLVVITHKSCWSSPDSPSGYATDGGFPRQMEALSELFDYTVLLLPCDGVGPRAGEMPLLGRGLTVEPLTALGRGNLPRKLLHPFWLLRNLPTLWREMSSASGVHALVPGDVGTTGMMLAAFLDKPLLVRHCGNWDKPQGLPERFCHWFMERLAGGQNVMLATGAGDEPPAPHKPGLDWIFSSSLREEELRANALAGAKSLGLGATCDPPFRLISACRQEPAKGTNVIIAALPAVRARHPNVQLDVVGDGSCLAELKAQARQLGVESQVVFHGKVDHRRVLQLLQQAHLFCFPTRSSEGFPKGVLEALSCGLPVITTRVSVLPKLISQGSGCGLVLDQPDAAALAQAIGGLLADPLRYRQMSVQALEVAASFSLENWRDTIGLKVRKSWGATALDPLSRCVPASLLPTEAVASAPLKQ